MSDKRVQIEVRFEMDLRPEEIWPDGVPEKWTAKDVLAAIKESPSADHFMNDWDVALGGAEVDVWVGMDHAREFLP